MSALPENGKWTVEAFLAFDDASPIKHEFYFGDVIAMAGASEKHVLISGNVFASLHQQLRQRDCRVYQSDLRVYVSENEQFFPDVMVLCGEPEFVPEREDKIVNPSVIIEILSPSTANFDRGSKFVSYRKLISLQHYVLVSQDMMMVEHYSRQADGTWVLSILEDENSQLALNAIDCQLDMADVYEKLDFGE